MEQFVLIAPDEKSEALTSEAQSKLMLSSVSLAVHNIGWSVFLLCILLIMHLLTKCLPSHCYIVI